MNKFITPTIGSSGHYTASAPFDSVVQSTVVYTCQSVRSIQDLLSNDEDPFGTIYQSIGLTQADFNTDVTDDVLIVGLSFGSSGWLNIPNRYFTSYPVTNGVEYQSKALSVNLGTLPTNLDLTNLISDVSAIVQSSIGIVTTPTALETSTKVVIDYTLDQANTASRLANVTDTKSYKDKYLETVTEVNGLVVQITALEDYIKANYVP